MTGLELAGGIALAAAAGCCFDGAVALQALETRALATRKVGAGMVRGLIARPRWLAATALAVLGWPLQVAALSLAPLTVVQPTLSLGLVLLVFLGVRLLGEPAGPRDLVAVGAIVAGEGLLAWAAPGTRHVHAGTGTLVAVLGPLAVLALLPWALRRHLPGWLLVLAAGCGFSAGALTTELLADELRDGLALAVVGWALLTGLFAAAGTGDEMGALQRVTAARTAAGALAVQVVVPVLAAPVLADEGWSGTPGGGAVILLGLLLVVAGSVTLGSTPAVSRLVEGSHGA